MIFRQLLSRVGCVAALLTCAGCVTTGKQVVERGEQALSVRPSCCKTLFEAKAVELPVEPTRYPLNEDSQVFEFNGMKSFFLLFRLPKFDQPYAIVLGSHSVIAGGDRALFLPVITLLDAQFQPSREISYEKARTRGSTVELTTFINAKDAGDAYLLVKSAGIRTAARQTLPQLQTTPIIGPGYAMFFTSGHDVMTTTHSSPTGILSIEIQKEK